MKNLCETALLTFVLMGCATSPAAQKDEPVDVHPVAGNDYANHFVSCRSTKLADVDGVLDKVKRSKGVVLYFHGGLSSDTYMKTKLGPWLMKSIFREENLNGLYPIFVDYDAGVFDSAKLADFLKQGLTQSIIRRIAGRLDEQAEKGAAAKAAPQDKYLLAAQEILRSADRTKGLTDEDYEDLLIDEGSQARVGAMLAKSDPELAKAARELEQLATEGQKGAERLSVTGGIMAIVKTLARFATRTNHQVMPTIEEEILRWVEIYGVGPGTFAQHHWDTVYERSASCWQPGRSGKYLVDNLLAVERDKKAHGEAFSISTLSHSAGSIPVAYLVNYLAKTPGAKLDNVVMIAPAINQGLFAAKLIPNASRIGHLKLFVLDLAREQNDSLVGGLYPASLLYFVSGVAETKGFGDRMLLIQQHLNQDREPYSSARYQRILKDRLGEDPNKIWNFFAANAGTVVYYDSGIAEPDHEAAGPSHECTKFPWATRDLGRAVLKIITGRPADSFVLSSPGGAKTCEERPE